jgi:sodium transport system permease protein
VNLRHVLHVFRKDGLEILRDRRTLFVNVVLPALLYPFIALFMVQVVQLTQGQQVPPPRVALIDLPPRMAELLQTNDDDQAPKKAAPSSLNPPSDSEAKPPVDIVPTRTRAQAIAADLPQRVIIALRIAALELSALEQSEKHERTPDDRNKEQRAKQNLLALLRANELAGIVISIPRSNTSTAQWFATYDNAHVHGNRAQLAVAKAAEKYNHELVLERLGIAGLGESDLAPLLLLDSNPLAPKAETIRTQFAGIIPMILVVFAALGAFYPAIDLIAGERERGTLETLLSWPVRRRDLFLGKLLVTCTAAVVSVLLNLTSLGITMALIVRQIAAADATLGDAISTGVGTFALCLGVLLPLTLTMGALSLALAGLATSAKEAQNYLSPMLLVVLVAAMVAAIPDTRPSLALDLIPITGSVLALKECLQGHAIPWFHLLVSTGASIALATVVVGWATRLLDDERFCYPGLVRAGWGRFRTWGKGPSAPNGLEVMGVFAVAVGGMTMGASLFQHAPAPILVAVPLLLFVATPALLHCWLGAYRPAEVLRLTRPPGHAVARAFGAIPFAILLSLAIGNLQPAAPPSDTTAFEAIVTEIHGYGPIIVLLCLAIIPGICEELLCRGTLLSGLSRGTGAVGGVLFSAFLFACLHMSPYRFLPQLSLGIFLALLALRYRSLIPCVILHAGHNAGVLLLPDIPGVSDVLEKLPPLAAFGIGVLGLWVLLIMPSRKERNHLTQ